MNLSKKKYEIYKKKYIALKKYFLNGGGNEAIIDDAIKYAKTLIGKPYRWHDDGLAIEPTNRFWVANTPNITAEEITSDKTVVCTGLINLVRRHIGLTIPGLDGKLGEIGLDDTSDYWVKEGLIEQKPNKKYIEGWNKEGLAFPGTTGIWFYYLAALKRLHKIEANKKYPLGTLILSNFKDIETWQGHVAIIIDDSGNNIYDQKILHAYSFVEFKKEDAIKQKIVGETGITEFFDWWKDKATHICYPKDWLINN